MRAAVPKGLLRRLCRFSRAWGADIWPVMTRFMRLLTFSLAVMIAVTSQHMAAARGAMADVAGQVVLCSGQGVQRVWLDRQGQPVEVSHVCPDCPLTLFADAHRAPNVAGACVYIQTLVHVSDAPWSVRPPVGGAPARGPPVIT